MRPLVILFLCTSLCFAQSNKDPYKFGSLNLNDRQLTLYDQDSTANAVFLYERGKTTFHETTHDIVMRTKYYAKVKIFNKKGEDHATVEIPIYNSAGRSERVTKVKGFTHNESQKTALSQSGIFNEKISENWSTVKFTMPNIKENSIIEYEYTFESPFKFNFKGWKFQTDIPKLHSEFYALIPGNYQYNRTLVGPYKLDVNEAKVKSTCFSIAGIPGSADCEELLYVMKDVPAFIEEQYMASKDNYLSALRFELSEYRGFDGVRQRFTKSWKTVDGEFKGEKSIGRQLRKVDYLKKIVPASVLTGAKDEAHAKRIYQHIKSHFNWNQKYRVFSDVNVKEAYDKKVGNATEINIALINALKVAGFDVELMLIATRKNKLPTKVHPVMTDFNYVLAKLNLDDKTYLLDATDKKMPFGMLPFRTLNSYGRVMNFKKGSYWHQIQPKHNTQTRSSLKLKFNEEGILTGTLNTSNSGYRGLRQRSAFAKGSETQYLDALEENNLDLEVAEYANRNLNDIDKPFGETYQVEILKELDQKTLLINPFIIDRITENPFKLTERSYPVDFGFSQSDIYSLQLEIPEGYSVVSLPENVAIKLPDNGGIYTFNAGQKGTKISLISRIKLLRSVYSPTEYHYLKEFFNQIIKTHSSLITLEKI